MKQLRHFLLTAALTVLGAAVWGCTDPDMEAELAARNARLDELEKQDQEIRDILYGKLNALRGKLLPIIDQIEKDMKDKIDKKTAKVVYDLADSVSRINTRIDKGFAEAQKYIDAKMTACYDDIDNSFFALNESQQALKKHIQRAINEGDSNLEKLLRDYERAIDVVTEKAEKAYARLSNIDEFISKAELIKKRLPEIHTAALDMQESFTVMEEEETKLLDAMNKRVSQEYLASLEIDQINELKNILSEAETIIDNIEGYKDDIESTLSDAEGLLPEMEDLASFLDIEVMSALEDAITQGADLRDIAEEWRDYFNGISPEDYLDEVNSAKDALQEVADSFLETVAECDEDLTEAEDIVYGHANEFMDIYNNAYTWADDAKSVYEDLVGYFK